MTLLSTTMTRKRTEGKDQLTMRAPRAETPVPAQRKSHHDERALKQVGPSGAARTKRLTVLLISEGSLNVSDDRDIAGCPSLAIPPSEE
jgi:hypothetical protein